MHDPKQIPNNNNTNDDSTFPALSNPFVFPISKVIKFLCAKKIPQLGTKDLK